MPDDKHIKGPADQQKININQPYEVQYWSTTLGVTPEELRRAVNAVGPIVADVRRHLQQRR